MRPTGLRRMPSMASSRDTNEPIRARSSDRGSGESGPAADAEDEDGMTDFAILAIGFVAGFASCGIWFVLIGART